MTYNKAKTKFIADIGMDKFKYLQQTKPKDLENAWTDYIAKLYKAKMVTKREVLSWPGITWDV